MQTEKSSSTRKPKMTSGKMRSMEALRKINKERQEKAVRRLKPVKSYRKTENEWEKNEVKELSKLAEVNTPTRVIGLKLGRTENSIRLKAKEESISLKPANRSPFNRSNKVSSKVSGKVSSRIASSKGSGAKEGRSKGSVQKRVEH